MMTAMIRVAFIACISEGVTKAGGAIVLSTGIKYPRVSITRVPTTQRDYEVGTVKRMSPCR